MSIQSIYNWLKGVKTPPFWRELMQSLQDIIFAILVNITKSEIEKIKAKIIEVGGLDISNQEKFNKVKNFMVVEIGINLRDSLVHLLIESLVNILKESRAI